MNDSFNFSSSSTTALKEHENTSKNITPKNKHLRWQNINVLLDYGKKLDLK